MRTLITSISPEVNTLFRNVKDFKFMTFTDISKLKQKSLLQEMDLVTANEFTDILSTNTIEKTKIISVREDGDVVTQAIIFNSTLAKTTVFYLKGRLDSNKLKHLSETNQFENLSNKLIQNYQNTPITPGFNPN